MLRVAAQCSCWIARARGVLFVSHLALVRWLLRNGLPSDHRAFPSELNRADTGIVSCAFFPVVCLKGRALIQQQKAISEGDDSSTEHSR